jgi:hypothetical protein
VLHGLYRAGGPFLLPSGEKGEKRREREGEKRREREGKKKRILD